MESVCSTCSALQELSDSLFGISTADLLFNGLFSGFSLDIFVSCRIFLIWNRRKEGALSVFAAEADGGDRMDRTAFVSNLSAAPANPVSGVDSFFGTKSVRKSHGWFYHLLTKILMNS